MEVKNQIDDADRSGPRLMFALLKRANQLNLREKTGPVCADPIFQKQLAKILSDKGLSLEWISTASVEDISPYFDSFEEQLALIKERNKAKWGAISEINDQNDPSNTSRPAEAESDWDENSHTVPNFNEADQRILVEMRREAEALLYKDRGSDDTDEEGARGTYQVFVAPKIGSRLNLEDISFGKNQSDDGEEVDTTDDLQGMPDFDEGEVDGAEYSGLVLSTTGPSDEPVPQTTHSNPPPAPFGKNQSDDGEEVDVTDDLQEMPDFDEGEVDGAEYSGLVFGTTGPSDEPVPQTTHSNPPSAPIKPWYQGQPSIPGLAPMIGALAASVIAVGAYEIHRQNTVDDTPSSGLMASSDTVVPTPSVAPTPTKDVEEVNAVFTPVYNFVVQKTSAGPDQDLRIAVANEWLVERHEPNAHDWTDIRKSHPWKEGPQALKALLGHLKDWGGHKKTLLAYEAAKARGEEPQSISELLSFVDEDPQLAKGTALRIAREIPLIKDERINSDLQLVLDAHQILNGYVDDTAKFVQSEYEKGRLKRPASSVYEMDSSLGALQLNVSSETAQVELEDLPDVTEYLEPLEDDSTQNAPSEAPSLSSLLADFKTEVSASTENLFKISRGENRAKIQAFNEAFEKAIFHFGEKAPTMTVEEQRTGIYELKAERFALLKKLTTVDGKYSNYLRERIAHEMQQLAQMEALLPVEGSIDAMRENIGRSALATLPDIFHQGPRKRNKRA